MDYYTEAAVNVWTRSKTFEQLLEQVKQYPLKRIIIFGQYEFNHWNTPVFSELIDTCTEKNITIDVVNGSIECFHTIPKLDQYNLYHYPTSFFPKTVYNMERVYNESDHIKLSDVIIKDISSLNYRYHFISMNRNAHRHRQEMLDILSMYDLIESNAISWHNLHPYPYNYKFWTPKNIELDKSFMEEGGNYCKVPKEYFQSFSQLVIESTSTDAMFITEKTVVPLLLGKPFLVASCQRFHKCLQELGFQLYDEIFDYSFDTEPNQTLRFCMIADNFRKLSTVPLDSLIQKSQMIVQKIEYNKNLAWKLATDYTLYPKPIVDVLRLYEKTGIILDQFTVGDYEIIKKLNNNVGII